MKKKNRVTVTFENGVRISWSATKSVSLPITKENKRIIEKEVKKFPNNPYVTRRVHA